MPKQLLTWSKEMSPLENLLSYVESNTTLGQLTEEDQHTIALAREELAELRERTGAIPEGSEEWFRLHNLAGPIYQLLDQDEAMSQPELRKKAYEALHELEKLAGGRGNILHYTLKTPRED